MVRGQVVVPFQDVQRDVVAQAERGEGLVRVKEVERVGGLLLDGLLLLVIGGGGSGRWQLGRAVGVRWWWWWWWCVAG